MLKEVHEHASPQWMTKQEVAAALAISERTVDNYIAQRLLSSRPQARAGKRPITVVSVADVERLRAEQNRGAILPPETKTPTLELVPEAAIPQLAQLAEALVARLARSEPAPPKPFLTIVEAAEYSGLPERLLRRFVRNGTLRAVMFGKEKHIWVKRCDVDALELERANRPANRARAAGGGAAK